MVQMVILSLKIQIWIFFIIPNGNSILMWSVSHLVRLNCIQNNNDRELLSFVHTAVNIKKLPDVRAKLNSSLSIIAILNTL